MLNQIWQTNIAGKKVVLYADEAAATPVPLVVLNEYAGDGSSVVAAMDRVDCPSCSVVSISDLAWDRDMAPWDCPPIAKGDTPCTGGADDYLQVLLKEILPAVRNHLSAASPYECIAGYSLGGLFALYAAYRTDAFARVASVSGSLWFPGIVDFAEKEPMRRVPERLYISLGDHEARTRNEYLRHVQENSEELVRFYREEGLRVTWELNQGNHFKQPALRTAKGIAAIVG